MRTFLRVAITLAITFLATGVAWAGSIDPTAGAVDGVGSPQSTTQIPPAWNQILPCETPATCVRFEVVMGGLAVLDKETGLVWQRAAGDTDGSTGFWSTALSTCLNRNLAGRNGWRLPSAHGLASLLDDLNLDGKLLPDGHPFTNIGNFSYWTATTSATDPALAWRIRFIPDDARVIASPKGNRLGIWCVRGGSTGPNQ